MKIKNSNNSSFSICYPTDKKYFKSVFITSVLNKWFNSTPLWNVPLRNFFLKRMIKNLDGKPYSVFSPLYLQFGDNLTIGKNFFSNSNCFIFDRGGVNIGDNVHLGPNVIISSVSHPMVAEQRIVRPYHHSYEPGKRSDIQKNAPVIIGNNVWIASGVIVCAGVKIGDNTVIGAGSVVTRDIPSNVFACGVPCKVLRAISKEDEIIVDTR